MELKGSGVEPSETSSVSFSMDDDPEGLEDSTWSYDTNVRDLDDIPVPLGGTKQADKEIRSAVPPNCSYPSCWGLSGKIRYIYI